jgi:hypothetical protein
MKSVKKQFFNILTNRFIGQVCHQVDEQVFHQVTFQVNNQVYGQTWVQVGYRVLDKIEV